VELNSYNRILTNLGVQIVSLLKRLCEKQTQMVVINRGEHWRIRVTTKQIKR